MRVQRVDARYSACAAAHKRAVPHVAGRNALTRCLQYSPNISVRSEANARCARYAATVAGRWYVHAALPFPQVRSERPRKGPEKGVAFRAAASACVRPTTNWLIDHEMSTRHGDGAKSEARQRHCGW